MSCISERSFQRNIIKTFKILNFKSASYNIISLVMYNESFLKNFMLFSKEFLYVLYTCFIKSLIRAFIGSVQTGPGKLDQPSTTPGARLSPWLPGF